MATVKQLARADQLVEGLCKALDLKSENVARMVVDLIPNQLLMVHVSLIMDERALELVWPPREDIVARFADEPAPTIPIIGEGG